MGVPILLFEILVTESPLTAWLYSWKCTFLSFFTHFSNSDNASAMNIWQSIVIFLIFRYVLAKTVKNPKMKWKRGVPILLFEIFGIESPLTPWFYSRNCTFFTHFSNSDNSSAMNLWRSIVSFLIFRYILARMIRIQKMNRKMGVPILLFEITYI